MLTKLYDNRRLADGYPDLEKMGFEYFSGRLDERPDERPALLRLMRYLNRLVDLNQNRNVLVVGCGPKPETIKFLREMGYDTLGVEPVPMFCESARRFLSNDDIVLRGDAENIPCPGESQNLVLLESVMEHVNSPIQSLKEVHRVISPGGIAYITTTNRYEVSLTGHNGEYSVRFFNWLPSIVKECYVFHHLHYKPSLANYTERPAVHWYCYSDLCKLGRQAGFARFYSILDLVREEDEAIKKSWLRRRLLRKIQCNPWLRALALTQIGGGVIMLKRHSS